jgi:hypothetical protein
VSDLWRCVARPRPAPYRVVSSGERGVVMEYAPDVESAEEMVEVIGGSIECFVCGVGWVLYRPAKAGKV